MRHDILVIIVTYNAMRWAERCFNSLKNSTVKPDVFVVDNGSTDGTQEYVEKAFPNIVFHQSKKNLGFGMANNLGFQYALDKGYEYVYLLNQDAWVMPDTFEQLINISKNYSDYAILSPIQMNSDLKHIDKDFIKRVCSLNSNPDIFNDLYNQEVKDVYPVKVVMAAHWFLTRKCIEKVGGFSPSFPHYGEDDNYADRVHYWDLKLGIVPTLRVVHDRGDRITTPQMIVHQCYIDALISLSKPGESSKNKIKSIIANFKLAIKYKKIQPFRNFCKILNSLRILENNKAYSLSQSCAFLDNGNA